jgi:hypothetical protein
MPEPVHHTLLLVMQILCENSLYPTWQINDSMDVADYVQIFNTSVETITYKYPRFKKVSLIQVPKQLKMNQKNCWKVMY